MLMCYIALITLKPILHTMAGIMLSTSVIMFTCLLKKKAENKDGWIDRHTERQMSTLTVLADYLVGLDALDIAGEVKVEVELVNIFGFVLMAPWSRVALLQLLLLIFLQGRFRHRGLDSHIAVLTPETVEQEDVIKSKGWRRTKVNKDRQEKYYQ